MPCVIAPDKTPYVNWLPVFTRHYVCSMGSLKLLVVVVWALCRGLAVVANIRIGGPYEIELEEFSPCTDIGSLGIKFNVLYTFEHWKVAYNGNLTFPYDEDDEELLTAIRFDKWGSTGGWKYEGTFERYDIMTVMLTYFPNAFKSFYGSMGITGKPMPAGTYQMVNFKPMRLKLVNFPELPYGHFRLMVKQSKDDNPLGCLELRVYIREIPS
ncbi:uncharacterized protein LOC124776322 [Schistocerca piceifrons]|uniref:uncharacterized protein LOC124776322 n=1 Tax=Schistocerca piceifrons TaxID=274613 RepID=UPI001F5F1554|nr:uncharacterized protein LOC124776322 [Schistocerca piceifrons]